jgi:hypothetical protein
MMLAIVMLALVQVAAPAARVLPPPTAEALRLGRELADAGTLAHLLPLMESAQVADLLGENVDMAAGDQAALRATAHRVFVGGAERLLAAEGLSYARLLSLGELRDVVGFERSAAGQAYRAATPQVITATMAAVGKIDFKGEVRAAFCKEKGKLCPGK